MGMLASRHERTPFIVIRNLSCLSNFRERIPFGVPIQPVVIPKPILLARRHHDLRVPISLFVRSTRNFRHHR